MSAEAKEAFKVAVYSVILVLFFLGVGFLMKADDGFEERPTAAKTEQTQTQ